mgnify:CR=1 FL=1
MAGCIGEYKVPTIFTSVLVACEVLFEVFIPLIMAQIVNVGMDTTIDSFTFTVELGKLNWVWFTLTDRKMFILACGGLMVAMALVSLFFGFMSGRLAAKAHLKSKGGGIYARGRMDAQHYLRVGRLRKTIN